MTTKVLKDKTIRITFTPTWTQVFKTLWYGLIYGRVTIVVVSPTIRVEDNT